MELNLTKRQVRRKIGANAGPKEARPTTTEDEEMTTKGTLPKLTTEQAREAVKKATAARAERKCFLDKVRSGELSFADAVEDPLAARVRIRTLVLAVPGYGKAKTDALLGSVGVMEGRRVMGLGSHQKKALVDALS